MLTTLKRCLAGICIHQHFFTAATCCLDHVPIIHLSSLSISIRSPNIIHLVPHHSSPQSMGQMECLSINQSFLCGYIQINRPSAPGNKEQQPVLRTNISTIVCREVVVIIISLWLGDIMQIDMKQVNWCGVNNLSKWQAWPLDPNRHKQRKEMQYM